MPDEYGIPKEIVKFAEKLGKDLEDIKLADPISKRTPESGYRVIETFIAYRISKATEKGEDILISCENPLVCLIKEADYYIAIDKVNNILDERNPKKFLDDKFSERKKWREYDKLMEVTPSWLT